MIDIDRYKAQVAAFHSNATQVAELYVNRLQAYTDERAATATMLEWVLQAVRPALPVLGGNIYESYDGVARRGVAFPERGVALLGGARRGVAFPERGVALLGGQQRSGDVWGGKQLVLFIVPGLETLPQALFAKLLFSGGPSASAARVWLTPESVVQEWPADKILAALHDRLLEELEGKAVDKRDEAENRTRKLRAVLELLA